MMSPLHWSFDYQTDLSGTSFLDAITYLLAQSQRADPQLKRQQFAVLPNHQAGTTKNSLMSACPLVYGQVQMQRIADGPSLNYDIQYYNDASGDDLHLRYQCTQDNIREVCGSWSITVSNKGSGLYKTFHADGALKNKNITLQVKDLHINNGQIPNDLPLICNWTLLDNFSALIKQHRSFNLLEDMEKIKSDCRIRAIGPWSFQGETYNGYTLQGCGIPETYYWLDQEQQVQLVSNAFSTFIRVGA